MIRLRHFFGTGFGLATLGCIALACWALLSGGLFDGPIAHQLRTSSVYATPGTGLDIGRAERIIGNRRLVVAFLPREADLSDTCDDLGSAVDGTIALLLQRDGDDYDKYGCSQLPGADDENFGKAFVAETVIGTGVDGFTNRPLEALKVAVVNYDQLAEAHDVPTDARTISPALPRYVIAAAAVAAVLLGAGALYLAGRRAARLAEVRRERRDAESDAAAELGAAAAVLAQEIIKLDGTFGRASRNAPAKGRAHGYQRLAVDYAKLLPALHEKNQDTAELQAAVDKLLVRAREIAK